MATPDRTRELLAKGRISIVIERYDDLFSTFDPRPYEVRTLSDDFLHEARKAAIEKDDNFELHILAPRKGRDVRVEETVKGRLHRHFHQETQRLEKERHTVIRNGILITAVGLALLVVATTLYEVETPEQFYKVFLIVLTEPAGWFTVWFGLEQIFYTAREKKPEIRFHRRMADAKVTFEGY